MQGGMQSPQAAALGELKAFLRLEHADEDGLLVGLLRAATAAAEAFLGEALVARPCEEELDPEGDGATLSCRPIRGVTLVERLGGDRPGPVGPEEWSLATDRNGRGMLRIDPAGGRVRVRYLAGRAADWNEVPEPIRFAVVRAAGHAFAHRDDAGGEAFPPAFRQWLAPWRLVRL